MKKLIKVCVLIFSITIVLISTACNSNGTSENNETTSESPIAESYNDVPTKEVEASPTDADYYEKLWETEVYNYKLIRNIPTVYESDSWETYCSYANIILNFINPKELDDNEKGLVERATKYRKELVQIMSLYDGIWYLWDDSMPMAEEAESLVFTKESYDNSDFKPFLIPYIIEDQSQVKGNMIIIAGGGYSSRGNRGEGYPIAKAFNELGYNCYVLQRRVEPYAQEDVFMDMQRAVRMVRYNIEKSELGGAECIIATGFSGGSGTILGSVVKYYGDIKPTITDSNYQMDEIDNYSADLNVACAMYGPQYDFNNMDGYVGLVTENPNIPSMFIALGEDDYLTYEDSLILAASIKDKVPAIEIHTFANVAHGFGIGRTDTNSMLWITLADGFITQIVKGVE